MRILDDTSPGGDSRAFAVEMELGDQSGDAALREQWASAAGKGEYGVPYALVLFEGGKVERSVLRSALARFNEPPDDGWKWTVEALAMHLLHDLCGITLADCRTPPSGEEQSGNPARVEAVSTGPPDRGRSPPERDGMRNA